MIVPLKPTKQEDPQKERPKWLPTWLAVSVGSGQSPFAIVLRVDSLSILSNHRSFREPDPFPRVSEWKWIRYPFAIVAGAAREIVTTRSRMTKRVQARKLAPSPTAPCLLDFHLVKKFPPVGFRGNLSLLEMCFFVVQGT